MAENERDPGTNVSKTQTGDSTTGANSQDLSKSSIGSNDSPETGKTTQENPKPKVTKASRVMTPEDIEKTVEKYVVDAEAEDIVSFNSYRIKKTWPGAYQALVEFMGQKAQFPDQQIDDELVLGTLLYSPRTVLYNFFDTRKIFINIHGSDEYWKYSLEANHSSEPFNKRAAAEIAGFYECFAILENQLINQP